MIEINIAKYVPDGTEYPGLAKAMEFGASSSILKAAENIMQHYRDKEDAQGINDVDITKDFRYSKGIIAGMKMILELPTAAKKLIDAAS